MQMAISVPGRTGSGHVTDSGLHAQLLDESYWRELLETIRIPVNSLGCDAGSREQAVSLCFLFHQDRAEDLEGGQWNRRLWMDHQEALHHSLEWNVR